MERHLLWARASCAISIAMLCSTSALAETAANPLLALDQHRTTVVERVVNEWGDKLSAASAGVNREQLREMLFAMRADQLLAASLAGSLSGLRDVLAHSLTGATASAPRLTQAKALGDSADDVVYTPVTPCRLVETRGTFAAVYQGGGAFSGGEVRNYTIQGGNGVCLTQLPAGLNPSAVQLQVFGIPINSGASGDIEILPQGSTFGSTATEVYVGNVAFNTVSTTAKINLANNQLGVQVRGGGANVAVDVVGYFKAPSGAGNYFVQGGNAFGTTAILGTTDNQPLNINVNGSRVMRYTPNAISPNVIGGHPANWIYSGVRGATIAGGGVGLDDPDFAFEAPNRVTDHYGTVGGGYANGAGNDSVDVADAPFATVGGGRLNTSSASAATVGGGRENIASNNNATVGGGYANHATGEDSTAGGGFSNTANGFASTVAGGYINTASFNYDAVVGGSSNTASGGASTVAGGYSNIASGYASFAAGQNANANHDGCFVWGDNSTANQVNCGSVANRFVVRAEGGVYFFAGFTGTNDQAGYKGVVLPPGAQAWVPASDRAGKDNLAPVDVHDVLRKIAAMPITTWNWKSQDASIRHMGPMAQDFHAAFGLGETPKGISTIDADGVALAAIQGLNAKLEESVADQQREITELRRMVLELRSAIDVKTAMH